MYTADREGFTVLKKRCWTPNPDDQTGALHGSLLPLVFVCVQKDYGDVMNVGKCRKITVKNTDA